VAINEDAFTNIWKKTEQRAATAEQDRLLAIIDEWHTYLKSLGKPNRIRHTYIDALEVIRERFTSERKGETKMPIKTVITSTKLVQDALASVRDVALEDAAKTICKPCANGLLLLSNFDNYPNYFHRPTGTSETLDCKADAIHKLRNL
jgi:hypothetical protein